MIRKYYYLGIFLLFLGVTSCSDDDDPKDGNNHKPIGELSEEWYTGGKLGTTFNSTSSAFEQSTPAVDDDPVLSERFLSGEGFFEDIFVVKSAEPGAQRQGLGPLYLRNSCIACHPGYGHGRRQEGHYNSNNFGNGSMLVLTDQNDVYLSSLTGMPQTQAVYPFKAPIDEKQIDLQWLHYTDEWGNKFPDGETYDLTYPEIKIPASAFYVPLEVNGKPMDPANLVVRLESTIGIYGTGLLDAITDEDLKAEYLNQEKHGVKHNPAIWADGNWTSLYKDKWAKRFTYALTRGPLQDGPGANAIWNITNVTRGDRRYHYMTETYAKVASNDPEVQKDFYRYYPERKISGNVQKDIYDYLMAKDLPAEMSDEDFRDFMVWHRGLAVPAARNLDDPKVQRGKKLFNEMGCATCHRPSWTTGEDNYSDPNGFFSQGSSLLPRYPYQKIWPYSDLIQHRLFMKNDIRTGWCRTTPLWGRGLSLKCTGAAERLHDCRARTVIEAIMWHGNPQSDARWTTEKFRKLSKSDRDAVVEFIESI